jgi:hypothetical protein
MTDPTADPDYRPGMEDDPTADPVIGPDDGDDGLATSYQPGAGADYVKVDGACMVVLLLHDQIACCLLTAWMVPHASSGVPQNVPILMAPYMKVLNMLNLCSAAAGGEACSRCCRAQ